MHRSKKPLLIIAFLFLIILSYQILDSYGIFESDTSSDISSSIAKWQILVNGSNITGSTNTFNIDTVNWETNSGVAPGKAAPGLSAYFEILINPSGSEVSIEYEIFLDFLNLNNDKISLISIKDKLGNSLTEVDANKYKGVIGLEDVLQGNIEKIRVEFTWENDESNNEIDSSYVGQTNPLLDIPISIRLSQYTE